MSKTITSTVRQQSDGSWIIRTGNVTDGGMETQFRTSKHAAEQIAVLHQLLIETRAALAFCGGEWPIEKKGTE